MIGYFLCESPVHWGGRTKGHCLRRTRSLPSPAPGPKHCGKRLFNWPAPRGERNAPEISCGSPSSPTRQSGSGRGAPPHPCEQRAVAGASPASGFRPNGARTRHECIWRQKEFRGKRVTPWIAFHKLPRAEEGGAYSSPLCLALRCGPGLSLACSIGGKHTGFGARVVDSDG